MPPTRRLAAIMFADIAGYTAMMHRDEADGMMRLRRFRMVLEQSTARHGGQILQHYGDGSLVLYDSAVEAVNSARAIQLALREEPLVPLRIGIHVGDIVIDGDYIYGDGVNVASRVEEQGVPGSVLMTDRVIYDIRNHSEIQLTSLGKFNLKNVTEPVGIYALSGPGLTVPGNRNKKTFSRSPRTPWRWVMAAALVVVLGSAGLWYLSRLPAAGPAEAATQSGPAPSIAVLPFRDLSAEEGQDYFGDGMAEEILNALAQVPGLKVAGRSSSFVFKGQEADAREVGEKLDVGTLLEGSVRRAGDRVRITARLVNTEDGYQLWSERYEREFNDIFAVQDEIARAVVDNLKVIFANGGKAPVVQPITESEEAYEWYLRGKHMLSQRADGAEKAVEFFRRAIALDATFAEAYAGLGNAYLWLGWGNFRASREVFPEAREQALIALQLDSNLAYAQSILGSVRLWYEWEWEPARQALEKAIRLNPAEGQAHLDLGWYHAVAGDFEQGIAEMEKAVALDPLNLEYNIDLADLCRMSGRYERALAIGNAMRETFPDNSEIYWLLGMIRFNLDDSPRAVEHFRSAVRLSGAEPWARMSLAMGLARAGQQQEARQLLQELEKDPLQLSAAPVEMAPIYWYLGEKDKALEWLERSYDYHANWMISLQIDPLWNPMRTEDRFQRLVRQMAFP